MTRYNSIDHGAQHGQEELDSEDYPYCECHLEPTEDEEMDNVCDCCGKPIS